MIDSPQRQNFESANGESANGESDISDIERQIPIHRVSSLVQIPDEWTIDIEILIKKWKDQIEKLSHVHQESGYINRTRYYRLAIPSIIIPFAMSVVSQDMCKNSAYPAYIVNSVMFMTTSILSAFGLFFSYNQLSEAHFQTSNRYTDISNRIDSELAIRRKFRTPSDVFITELKCRIESLGENAPQLPGFWC